MLLYGRQHASPIEPPTCVRRPTLRQPDRDTLEAVSSEPQRVGDVPVRPSERVVLKEQERRLPVVVEAALEVFEPLVNSGWRALQRTTQDKVFVNVDPCSNRVENGFDSLDVEAEDKGLFAA